MKKLPYFLMVVCLVGGLAACGGGSSGGEPAGDTTDDGGTTDDGDTTGDRGVVDEITSYCSSDSNVTAGNVVSVCGTSLDSAIATAREKSALVNSESLEGLWVISSDFESEALFNNEVQLEQGQVLTVFQIASTEVEDEIEIIECSGDFWGSGEVISFADEGNDYDGSTGKFVLTEPQILLYADAGADAGADAEEQFDATIVSNTEITFSPYTLHPPSVAGVKYISGTANNIVANKVRDSAQSGLGRISYNTEDFDILCAQVVASETRTGSAQGDLVSREIGFIADGVDFLDANKKTRLLISELLDGTGQSKYAYIGPNKYEREIFYDSDVVLSVYDDLTFSGSLGSLVTFDGDIKNFEVE